MDSQKEFLESFEKELLAYKKVLAQAAEIIVEQEVSNFPILVVHQEEIAIGIPIVEREKVKGNWSVNASTMEEFITRQIISEEKTESFQSLYQQHPRHLCVFFVIPSGANFIFLPKD